MWDGVDRRKGPDFVSHFVNLLNVTSWDVFLVALIFFHYARPEMNTIIHQMHDIPVRLGWVNSLRDWMILSLYVCIGISVMTLIFNNFRLKRKTDFRRYNQVFLLLVSAAFVGVVTY